MLRKLLGATIFLFLITVTFAEAQVLTLSPPTPTVVVGGTQIFTAAGGAPPYTFIKVPGRDSTGGATLVTAATTAQYTSGPNSGATEIQVTDSAGSMETALVTVNPALTLSPSTPIVVVGGIQIFTAAGGAPPYTFIKVPGRDSTGGATLVTAATTAQYTSGPNSGTTEIQVTDSAGSTETALVTVNPALTLSPLTPTVAVGGKQSFTGMGGVPPYTFSKVPGRDTTGGALLATTPTTALYTAAGPNSGTTEIQVADSAGNTVPTTVTVNPSLTLSPLTPTVVVRKPQIFTGTGGVPPYTFSKVPGSDKTGGATLATTATTAEYTSGPTDGSTMIRVKDSSTPPKEVDTRVTVILSDNVLDTCKRDDNLAIYTNDLPTWRFGKDSESFSVGGNTFAPLGWLPDGEWTVGTALLSETIKYDFAKKRAAFFEGAGVGASFRFYTDVESVGRSGDDLKLHQIKSECRSTSLQNSNNRTIATPMFSITPTIFASKPLKDQEFRVEPAIMLGFFQDLVNVGVGFNLTGDNGDVGDVFLLFSLGFGFNFGGSATADQP